MDKKNELNRLTNDVLKSEANGFVVDYTAECGNDASEVNQRIKDVIKRIIETDLSFDEPIEKWESILPEWFINSCSLEISKDEAEKLLSTPEGYALLESMWTVSGFIYWFRPEMRSWYWLSSKIEDENTLLIKVLVYSDPFASGALKWLITASGAKSMKEVSQIL
jgi:hypothetical protein